MTPVGAGIDAELDVAGDKCADLSVPRCRHTFSFDLLKWPKVYQADLLLLH